MVEWYVEQVIMRKDNQEHVTEPMFTGVDIDAEFEFEGHVQLTQITNNETNAVHNDRQYVLKILSIDKLEKQE
ncbi:hypothetical protein LCGC14_0355690 [marine sediment metagenome]|uniref:Uncharacterized protein n=1 Tax=marine sediment metagenome TaxID=412755 RepID=A0A0F9TSB5_9ZZZZ